MIFKNRNYIKRKFEDLTSENTFESINPSTEEVIGIAPISSQDTVRKAVRYAKGAFESWRKVSRVVRAEYFDRLCDALKRRKDEIAWAISLETGKNLNESIAEVNEALHMAQYTFGMGRTPVGEMMPSEIAEKDAYVIRKPKGVVAVISPWNFPFAIGGFWNAAPAILEGNTVVFKPSEETPYIGQLTAELYHEAGFPEGVFNLVHGTGEVTGAALVDDPEVAHICFTGSAEVGMIIRKACAASWNKTCSCEMGSKSAVIVCEDANLDMAVNACVASAFKLSGQRCVSAGRLLVETSILHKFVDKFVEAVKDVKPGDPFVNNCFMGPLINKTQMEKVLSYNESTRRHSSAKVMVSGERLDRKGWFLTPHVYISDWYDGGSFLREEVFGPHVAIVPFNDIDSAISIYNDTPYGLSVAVCTEDYRKMRLIRDNCDYGLGYANLPCIGAESHLPFSGVKKSGVGGASAAGTFDTVVNKVTWTVNHEEKSFKMAQGLK